MSKVFLDSRSANPLMFKVPDGGEDSVDWASKNKQLIVGVDDSASVMSYSNIVIKTTPDQTFPSKLEIDLSDVEASDGSLKLKLRKVKVCDGNGNTGQVYVLCSEVFQSDTGFNSGDELMSP
jgi:hypothetical protein